MGPGFSPLDETLGLLSGVAFTPWLVESIVRLGTLLPFAQAPEILQHFTGVTVSAATVRRLTEVAGAMQEQVERAEVARLERELPAAPAGPAVQLLSVDGAMAPLVGGTWAEVKTLAIGTVEARATGVRTQELSYFSRLADAETFTRLATIETQRRGQLRPGRWSPSSMGRPGARGSLTRSDSMRSGCLTSPMRWSTWGRWRTPSTGRARRLPASGSASRPRRYAMATNSRCSIGSRRSVKRRTAGRRRGR